jgi:hypothetical protein
MRRLEPILPPDEALKACEAMLRTEEGLALMLPALGPGATVEDARLFRERLIQSQRTPSACMRRLLGMP